MLKITCLFVLALIGAVFTLPSGDAINQRDPVQIKISNEEEASALIKNENLSPVPDQDLNESLGPESLAIKDENLEPSETFGFGYGIGYGGWGSGYRGYGGYGYGGYGGYGGRGYGWGRRYSGYGGNGWGRGYGGGRWGNYYW